MTCPFGDEERPKRVQASELSFDIFGEITGRRRRHGRHALPEEPMVPRLAGIVEQLALAAPCAERHQVFQGLEICPQAIRQAVGHGDIARMVLAVVKLQGHLGDHWFKRVVAVRQVGQFKHLTFPQPASRQPRIY